MEPPPDRLRICLVSAAYLPYPSGVSEHVAHLGLALSDRGHHVEVLTTHFADSATVPRQPDRPRRSESRITVHRAGRAIRIPANGSYATLPVGLKVPAQTKRVVTHGSFDIVHCHGFAFPEIAYWAIRYSHTANVVSLLAAGSTASRRGGRLFRTVFRRHLARIDAVIALSGWAAACHEAYVPGPYTIVPSGVDLNRFHPAASSHQPARSRTVLFVGRLDARKGLSVLLPAFAEATARVPDARLVIVGSGPGEADARRSAELLGISDRVHFAGRVSRYDLPRFYASAGLYVSSALGGESFGIVLLEAMASGAPVIASNIRGYDEVVRDGVDGLLVPPGDVPALSHGIVRVLTDDGLAERLRRAGLSRATEFAWPEIARRTEAVYEGARVAHTRSKTSR